MQPFFVDVPNFSARRYRELPECDLSRLSRSERMAARGNKTTQAGEQQAVRQQERDKHDVATVKDV